MSNRDDSNKNKRGVLNIITFILEVIFDMLEDFGDIIIGLLDTDD